MLELEKYVNYPKSSKQRDWKNIKKYTKVRLEDQAERRNRHCTSRMIEVQIGQLVLVKKDGLSSASRKISVKLNPLYIGPFEILKRLGISTCVIENKEVPGSEKVYNIRNLHPYYKRSPVPNRDDNRKSRNM